MAEEFEQSVRLSTQQRQAKVGYKEVIRQIMQGHATVVFLADDTSEQAIKDLIEAGCRESKVPLIKVDSKETLGKWAGLAKIDDEGEVVKARSASCVGLSRIPVGPAGEKLKAFIEANQA